MPTLYRIKNWDDHFENNRTRDLKSMSWVPMPNKMDGDGYTELVDHPDGAAHFGAWVAIVEVASKCDPRGTLLREGARPHNPASLARISRLKKEVFEQAIPRLVQIGWLEVVGNVNHCDETPCGIPQERAGLEPQGDAPSRARAERNGTERNGTEREKRKRFAPPTAEEVAEYAREKGYKVDSESFVDFYESKGWMVGSNKMKDWRAAVRNWTRRDRPQTGGKSPPKHGITTDWEKVAERAREHNERHEA